jgi:hypothetical protein
MQSLRPEDRLKAVLLSVLVVVVFSLVGWRSVVASQGPPSTKQTVTLGTSGTSIAGGSTAVAAKAKEKPITIATPPPTPKNDPFRSLEMPKGDRMPAIAVSRPEVMPYQPLTGDISPAVNMGAEKNELATAHAPTDAITVEGVVTGGKGVAILKVGDQTVIVKGGYTFASGYQLIMVTDTEVVVKKGAKLLTLFVKWG